MTDNAAFVGSIPAYYDKGLVPNIFEDYADELCRRVVDLAPSSVLELAAGTGVVTERLVNALPTECSVVATDLNEPMLEITRSKVGKAGNLTLQTVDAMALPFDEASLDVIACQFGVMFFPDKVASMRQAHKVLKPGGTYLFNAWDSLEENPFASTTQGVANTAFPQDPPQFYNVPFHYHDVEEIESDVKAAGFSSVEVERRRLKKTIKSLDDFTEALLFGNPIGEEIKALGREPSDYVAPLKEKLMAQFGENPSVMPLSALFVTAVK